MKSKQLQQMLSRFNLMEGQKSAKNSLEILSSKLEASVKGGRGNPVCGCKACFSCGSCVPHYGVDI